MMDRIKDKDTVSMLDNVLKYSIEDMKVLAENAIFGVVYSTKEGISRQIAGSLKNGYTNIFYARVDDREGTRAVVLERVAVEFDTQST